MLLKPAAQQMVQQGLGLLQLALLVLLLEVPSIHCKANLLAGRRSHRQLQAAEPIATDSLGVEGFLQHYFSGVSCASGTASKQSCLFHNVCFVFGAGSADQPPTSVTVVRMSGSQAVAPADADQLLQQHLSKVLEGQFATIRFYTGGPGADGAAAAGPGSPTDDKDGSKHQQHIAAQLWKGSAAVSGGGISAAAGSDSAMTGQGRRSLEQKPHSIIKTDEQLTVLWRAGPHQYSLGHIMGNSIFPLFMLLLNHVPEAMLPTSPQILVTPSHWEHKLLPHVMSSTISHNVHLLSPWLNNLRQKGRQGVCFRNLIVGDGGYMSTTFDSIGSNVEAEHFGSRPTFFDSRNWEAFKNHALVVAGVLPQAFTRHQPLIVLNDKRYHADGSSKLQDDRRMLLDIDKLEEQLRSAYPMADVLAVRFRDMSMTDQIRIMSVTRAYITTGGSSSHSLVFMPRGSTVILIGQPEDEITQKLGPGKRFQSFEELDRWYPLTYVKFQRYVVDMNDPQSYEVKRIPGYWEPGGEETDRWWRYNANVRVNVTRLQPMLDRALGIWEP